MDDFLPPTHESIWKVTRQLKKEQSSLYNCVASVLSDAAFVSEVRDLYPSLPLLANLRCGLWYTRQADGTCYFKSTDGHNGNWSFSCTRLNWHVCELAAAQGGVIIVDATRKGKRFPDAMTKTIPIWAAVVNRAVARKRAEAAARIAAVDSAAKADRQRDPEHEEPPRNIREANPPASRAPCMPITTSPQCAPRRDRCGSTAVSALPGTCPAWLAAEGDAGSGCTRVGSLSQWLQSPMAARVEDGAAPITVCPFSGSTRLQALSDDQGCCLSVSADGKLGAGDLDSSFGPDLSRMDMHELQEEVSFGDVEEALAMAEPQHDQQQQQSHHCNNGRHSPAATDMCSAVREVAAGYALSIDPGAESATAAAAVSGAEPPAVGVAQLKSPFALAAASASSPTLAAVSEETSTAAAGVAAPGAVAAGGSYALLSAVSVDLGAASASHVSCSPEEVWRCGGLFGGVVDECGSEQMLLRCYSNCGDSSDFAQSSGGGCAQAVAAAHQQQAALQDSDGDAEGSAGSCSDTSGPAGFSGLASTRTSTCSSLSSLCGSRSSSCSSDHSDSALDRSARPGSVSSGCRTGKAACFAAEPSTRVKALPRHQSCSAVGAPPPGSPSKSRRCGSLPARSAAASHCSGGVGGRLGNGRNSSYSSGSSLSSSSAGCAATLADAASPGVAGGCGCGGCALPDGDLGDGDGWDVGLHLPLWISSNERAQIEKRLDGWVDSLLRVGADVEALAKVLSKPLRPLWISQSSTIWVDQVAQPDQLPFTPLYLVSASLPHSYVRQAGGVLSGSDADGDSSDGCCHAGDSAAARRHHGSHHHQRRERQQHQQPHSWTYVYVPGAGDDEESWAAGLTPAVFWAHYTELLQAGPAGVHDAVRQVLQREAAALAERGTNSSIVGAASATHGSPANGAYAAATDTHHLMPAGCRGSGAVALIGGPVTGLCASGLYFVGSTGIALGDLTAGAAPGCWSHVDAVLSCGLQQHPSMAGEPQWPRGDAHPPLEATGAQDAYNSNTALWDESGAMAAVAGAPAGTRGGSEPCSVILGHGAEEGPEKAESEAFSFRPVACLCCVEGTDVAAAVAAAPLRCSHDHQQHQHRHHHRRHHTQGHRPAPRYLHLRVEHYKHHRTSLMLHLDTALEFLSYHISRGHKVLIHDTNGLDTCVCVAVALLLASNGSCGSSEARAPSWGRAFSACSSREGGGGVNGSDGGVGPEAISKEDVRQRLAFVSSFYPPARPTRGMLRQVFNHFVRARGGAVDGAEDAA